jgi:hypothetical protein
LLAAIVTCTVLRRAIPFESGWLHPYVIFTAGFVGLFAIGAFKDFTPAGQAVAKQDDLEVFYTGGLAMLAGVVLSVANTLFEIRRRN